MKLIKRDGHTHTHFCLHGSGEEAEAFVVKAIAEGFEEYSFTEHIPLPAGVTNSYPQEIRETFTIIDDDLDPYVREMERLQKKYRDRIKLNIGLEVDFLPNDLSFVKEILREYGPYLQDSLLSVHFLYTTEGYKCVDFSPEDFQEKLLPLYGTYEEVQLEYYRTIQEALAADLGPYKPRRIGHLSLCNKFQHALNPQGSLSEKVKVEIRKVLGLLKEKGVGLDVNMAGLFKEHCRETYPSPWIIQEARELGIPLVYGSDAHSVEDVGRGYDTFRKLVLE